MLNGIVRFTHKSLILFLCVCSPLKGELYSPDLSLEELFQDVQLARIFPDSKIFPDTIAKSDPKLILKSYREDKERDLKTFVASHFEIPEIVSYLEFPFKTMEDYVTNWDFFVRSSKKACHQTSSLIPLPYPYVIAGGRFREMYYWDGYFIMLGLSLSGRWDLFMNMLKNYAYLIDHFGFIPNGNRTYYLTRSQPPFFSLMVCLYASHRGMKEAAHFLPQLEKEYCFWMDPKRVVGSLNHYWDIETTPRPESYYEDFTKAEKIPKEKRDCFYRNRRASGESGWDFSSRWRNETNENKTCEILPVDLNVLLYHLEKLIGELYAYQGCEQKASFYFQQAYNRRSAIQKTFWDPNLGFYQDYNFVQKKWTGHLTLAGVFPLLFKIADTTQAEQVVKRIETDFLYPGGLVTTLQESGEQWDYPNGWAPLQWVAVQSLCQYGYDHLAKEIARRWLDANIFQLQQTGHLYEKYNVVDPMKIAEGGEYEQQVGFGWTNGVALFFLNLGSILNPLIFKEIFFLKGSSKVKGIAKVLPPNLQTAFQKKKILKINGLKIEPGFLKVLNTCQKPVASGS